MKTKTLLTAVLINFMIASTVYSQTKDKSDANYFLGTWSGMVGRSATDKLKMDYSIFIWRIHKVDTDKDQIEMTEVYYKPSMYDTISTEKPRMSYLARIEGKSLSIQLTDLEADTTFMLKLSPDTISGMQYLKSEPGKLRFQNRKVGYVIRKIDDDSGDVPPKDQRMQVEVIVQPPPPVEPKKN